MVSVTMNRAHLSARLKNGRDIAGAALAEQILADCNNTFIPWAEGTLKDSGRVEKLGEDHAATWNTVYAAYQYYGCWPDGSHVITQHNTDHHPEASILWCERGRDRYGNDWETLAQKKFTEGAGG